MKEIKAYLHRSRVADVVEALKNSPAWGGARGHRRHNLALYIVKGFLLPVDEAEKSFSIELSDEVVNEYKLELICEDTEVDEFVSALVAAARTGQKIAGWITVTDLVQAVSIH